MIVSQTPLNMPYLKQNKLHFCKLNPPARNKRTANEILILIRSIKVKVCTDTFSGLKVVLKSENSRYKCIRLPPLGKELLLIFMNILFPKFSKASGMIFRKAFCIMSKPKHYPLFPYVHPLILLGYLISSRLPIIPNKLIRTCYERE